MALNILARLIRNELDRLGYVLWKREYFRYGISPFVDISRLNRAWGRSVKTFFDIGANLGQTAQQALKEFPEARVYAFEPHPNIFNKLQNTMANDRTSLHQLAMGEQSGTVKLYVYGDSGDGSLINSLVPNARYPMQFGYSASECMVECSTIDQFCLSNNIERVDVLKIDTEGFDLSVMKGAKQMLTERRVGFIYTEFNDLQPKQGTTGGALLPISEYLTSFGFRYISTYTDFILPEGEMHICANALFACPPGKASQISKSV